MESLNNTLQQNPGKEDNTAPTGTANSAGDRQIPYERYSPYKNLGKRHRDRLKLSPQEVHKLNQFSRYVNLFNSIEGCEIAIIKFYLLTLKLLDKRLKAEGSTLEKELEPLKKMTASFDQMEPSPWHDADDMYIGNGAVTEFHNYLFRKAEAILREHWKHSRQVTIYYHAKSPDIKASFDQRLGVQINEIMSQLIPSLGFPDRETEIALNVVSRSRWKVLFAELTAHYKGKDHNELVAQIKCLVRSNKKNRDAYLIYYEASNFFAEVDKVECLKFYLRFIWKGLHTAKFKFKTFIRSKYVFAKPAHLKAFKKILDEFMHGSDFPAALKAVDHLFLGKRKSIVLDTSAADFSNPHLQLSSVQRCFLLLFANDQHTASVSDVENFVRAHSQFKDQLIDQINEFYYGIVDDVTIEETKNGYVIHPDYYAIITAK